MITSSSIFQKTGGSVDLSVDLAAGGAGGSDSFAWIDLTDPVTDDFDRLAGLIERHELAIEDAVEAGQRPKVERYGETLVAVFRPARLDVRGSVVYDELFVAVGDGFVLTVAHGPLQGVVGEARRRMLGLWSRRVKWL